MRPQVRIVVDPTSCGGKGLCAELFPERITLDPWGYPIVQRDDIAPELMEHARRAVHMCPQLALHLVEGP
jgi:ferredoxin